LPHSARRAVKELQDHAAKTQNTLVDALKNTEVAEIKRFRALRRLRAASIKELDAIARLETRTVMLTITVLKALSPTCMRMRHRSRLISSSLSTEMA
jgi:hypothetical protein